MTTRTRRVALGLTAAGALALGVAAPAGAHVVTSPGEVPAGSSTTVAFVTGHGCDGSPTNRIAIQVPEEVTDAKPQWLPGWEVESTTETLAEPIESAHGEPQTERVSEITFTATPGNELPDGVRGTYTIAFTAPDAAGTSLAFPVVQGCVEGETPWIEETVEGEEEPEHPAPVVSVGDAVEGGDDGHGDAGDEATTDGDEAEGDGADGAEEVAADGAATASDDGDDGGSDGLAVAGLVTGVLGLVAGGVALLRTRART